jgi:CRISPR-associated protein Cas6
MLIASGTAIAEIRWSSFYRGLPDDHGYATFSALCRAGVVFHDQPDTQVLLDDEMLVIRCPVDRAWRIVSAEFRSLNVNGVQVALGSPAIVSLTWSPSLYSRMVTIKPTRLGAASITAPLMRDLVLRQLALAEVSADVEIGPRRVARIAKAVIVGYGVVLRGLVRESAITILSRGLGGRNRMGCGVFVPC